MLSFDEIKGKASLMFKGSQTFTSAEDSESNEEETSVDRLEELSEYCPQLTFQQRLIGFSSCFSIGYLITFFSFKFFVRLLEGNPIPFACNYTFGHSLQLLASTFLCGPKRQFRNMFDEKRCVTSIVYLSCLASTLCVIFVPLPFKLIVLLALMLTQLCASCWYSLSYIPFGRRAALRFLKKVAGIEDTSRSSYMNIFRSGAEG